MFPLIIAAGLAAAGGIAGGLIGKGGADAAAGALGAAGDQAVKNAHQTRVLNAAMLSPWTGSGAEAQNLIAGLLGIGKAVPWGDSGGFRMDTDKWQEAQTNALARFQPSPDYQFRFTEGLRALDRSAAARGNLLSGGQLKAAQDFGGNLASGEYGNWFNRLMGVSGMGLNASNKAVDSNLGTLGLQNQAVMGTAAGQGAAYQSGSNALASGINSGLSSAASILGMGAGGGFGGMMGGLMGGGGSSIYGGQPWNMPGAIPSQYPYFGRNL